MSRFVVTLGLVGCTAQATEYPPTAALGEPATTFELSDLAGVQHTLATHAGKTVVLEWFNPGCPYVKHAHAEGPLTDQATRVQADGIVWIAINSGAPGKQGHGVDTNTAAVAEWSMGHPVLIDEDGAVGHAYGAVTTPHMFVIDPAGTLVYRGAIDNKPLGKGDGQTNNFVDMALADLKAERPVGLAETKPYGCSVKY